MPPLKGQEQPKPKAKFGLINTDQVSSFAHEHMRAVLTRL